MPPPGQDHGHGLLPRVPLLRPTRQSQGIVCYKRKRLSACCLVFLILGKTLFCCPVIETQQFSLLGPGPNLHGGESRQGPRQPAFLLRRGL